MFTTTVLVTVSTDLLWGIAAGIAAKLLLEAAILAKVERGRPGDRSPIVPAVGRWMEQTGELFRDPVLRSGAVGDEYHLYFGRPLVCFNSMHLEAALARIPGGSSSVFLHITDLVTLIDHTAASALLDFVEDFQRSGRGVARIIGLDHLQGHSRDEACLRVSAPVLAAERAEALAELDRVCPTRVGPGFRDPIAYLEQVHLTHVGPIGNWADWADHPITDVLIGACRSVGLKLGAAATFARTLGIRDQGPAVGPVRDRQWYSIPEPESGRDWPPSLHPEGEDGGWPPSLHPEGEDGGWPPSLH